jgi:nitrite reductase/ring-hydroxylating ferredoxin subunit
MSDSEIELGQNPVKWSPAIPASRRNYPMNCWWVAAFSDEVGQKPVGRWLLDTPVLLYRTAAGEAVALDNRCPHRGAPLSLGTRKGDAIQCGYHGFTFGPDGACTRIPSMKTVVSAVRARRFPIIENAPFVWIYVGDIQRALSGSVSSRCCATRLTQASFQDRGCGHRRSRKAPKACSACPRDTIPLMTEASTDCAARLRHDQVPAVER